MVSENKLIDSLDKKEKQQIQFENELERMAEVFSEIDPEEEIAKFNFDEEKALTWLNEGAVPTDTVRSIFSKNGTMKKFLDSKKTK